ncbi:MFS transporter [Nocardioides plantarum]|uniref:MFS transporter n=1 Tax=Nocardioides plantarum TaxID=29299 RepID=A0ABV5KHZ4_9ACTN|nr:MFS transporter [Nocardioides plantarum]
MTRSRTLLFAVAGAAAVGNLYWAQPLLDEIAGSLDVPTALAGLLVTVTQVGYAVGIFLLVPLGDVLNRKRLIPLVMAVSGLALGGAAVAPSWATLFVALLLVGSTAVGAQLLIPLASELADPAERGRVVGTIASGALVGILLSRTVSGIVADLLGWRAIYVIAAVVSWALALTMARVIPALPARPAISYASLLRSVFTAIASRRAVPVTLVLGAATFGTFTLFWTALTFLLTAPPFSYSLSTIGLVGLAGLAGALIAQRAGRLHDRGLSVPVAGAALVLGIASLALAAVGSDSIVVLLIAIVAFDVAVQATMVLSQTRLLSIDPAARSRMNTAFITSNFIGGAIGSAAAGLLWHVGGWNAVLIGGVAALSIALLVWGLNRQALRVPAGR